MRGAGQGRSSGAERSEIQNRVSFWWSRKVSDGSVREAELYESMAAEEDEGEEGRSREARMSDISAWAGFILRVH